MIGIFREQELSIQSSFAQHENIKMKWKQVTVASCNTKYCRIFRNIYCSAKPRSHGVKAAGRNTKDDIGDLVVTDCQLAQLLSTNVHNFSLSGT